MRRAASRGRRTRACCGASSFTIMEWPSGWTATRRSRRLRRDAGTDATAAGGICTTATCFRCPTTGSIPWYAAWDLAYHMIPFAEIDPHFAKEQLMLLLREWYMHPNGQIPAYEFAFGDVNPPVHAWACWRVYKMTGPRGERDRVFLERVFQKLLINFTWWVNRKDVDGKNIFSGGFLGLDNIGVFDRSQPLPGNLKLEQADGTAWMAFYCLTMLSMALELAREDPAYEDVASKFFEHFVAIADAMNTLGGNGLWDEEDGFYYDQLRVDGTHAPVARALGGGADPAGRGDGARVRGHRPAARLSQTHGLVPRKPPGPVRADFVYGAGRFQWAHATGCWRSRRWGACCAC